MQANSVQLVLAYLAEDYLGHQSGAEQAKNI